METSFDFGINWDTWSDENGNLDQTIDDYLQQNKSKSTQYKISQNQRRFSFIKRFPQMLFIWGCLSTRATGNETYFLIALYFL